MAYIILITSIGVAFSIIGDLLLKESAMRNSLLLLTGAAFYALSALPVALLFTRTQFGIVFIIWEAAVTVIAVSIGALVFHEPFTPQKLLALILVIATLYLSSY